ncbi:MAG TPA: WecB/TagA/CpsF family glycosyltransferase [Opitutaceae bacterium]|nr:WecB/TagA/CpsF family glycosyltransferase [Opitutaceae bacterium]
MPELASVARPRGGEAVLGISFFNGSLAQACDRAAGGGLLTAPSGPGLACDLRREPAYRRALQHSDLVLTDSAFMVVLWWVRTGKRLPRNSGLAFLRIWMNRELMRRPGAAFWVLPDEAESRHTQAWLQARGFPADPAAFHTARVYGSGEIEDQILLQRIEEYRPEIIYIGIGGGVQERLGLYLRDSLGYRPLILCLGAAIAFMTGAQVQIAPWVDRCGLGWLWRIVSSPSRYAGRYLRAVRLAWMIFRFGDCAPPLATLPESRTASCSTP